MADTYLTLRPTALGLDGIIQSLYGGSITFTKLCVGNGVPEDPEAVTEMVNPLLDIGITSITQGDKEVILTGYVTTQDVQAGFYANEIGVYAKGSDNVEYLFAYGYNASDVDYYPDSSSGRTQELTITLVIAVGAAENVDAILIEGDAYAKKTDFDDHVGNTSNPHRVTKAQVGLGNVDNVSVQNMAPTFTQATTASNISSGEKLPTLFGKIAKGLSDLITHLSNFSNPHRVTISQIGAAAANHTHSTSAINSGTLSIARGGTGASTPSAACDALGAMWQNFGADPETGKRDYGRMISSGLLIQWGDCGAPRGDTNAYEVTLPLAFKSTSSYVVMATVEGAGSSTDVTIRVERTAANKFTARCFNNGTPTHTIGASYIAIGLWK